MFSFSTLTRRQVYLFTKSGRTISGVLWRKRGPLLVLRNARLLEHDRETPMDGEVVVERREVDFIQVPPAKVG